MPTNDDDQRLETCDELDEVHSVQQQDNTHLVLLATPKPTADPSTSLGKRRVSFAPGARGNTDDGHPHHTGRASKARKLPPYECEPLTRRNIAALEAELGPVNQPSIERLKRRLAELQDDVAVQPSSLGKPVLEALRESIEARYIDKVIQHLGLVIALYDILSSEGDFIYPCEGAVRYKVRFQVIVFRPYINEVFNGTLKAATRDGLFVSLGFFDDVFVPSSAMPSSTLYKEDEAQWIWVYDDPEEGRVELYYDVGQPIRVKVTGVRFSPVPPPPELQPDAAEGKVGTRERPYQPMVVEASVLEDGLGLCVWWLEDAGGD